MMLRLVPLALAFLAFGPAPAAAAGVPAAAQAAIDTANSDWERCIRTADAECIVSTYADDGLFILPDGTVIAGKAAVRNLYAARAKSGATITDAAIHSTSVVAAGDDLVFESGTGSVTARAADGTVSTRGGPYLTVWRRNADGVWQITRNLVF